MKCVVMPIYEYCLHCRLVNGIDCTDFRFGINTFITIISSTYALSHP